jgi:hypothetical protein
LNGDGNLTKLSSFVAGYEKNVETFTQYATSGDTDFFCGNLPELKCLARARNPDSTSCLGSRLGRLQSQTRNQAGRNPIPCNRFRLQHLVRLIYCERRVKR